MQSSKSKNKLIKVRPTESNVEYSWSFDAIGTKWWIGLYKPISPRQLKELQLRIQQRIEKFDVTYSRFRTDSLVAELSRASGSYAFPDDSLRLFSFYRNLHDITDKKVTPLIGQLLSDSGYDAKYSFRSKTMRPPLEWDEVLIVKGNEVTTEQLVLLDFGAAGKGYLVDIVGELILSFNIPSFCIDAGGDILCRGLNSEIDIGLEDPDDLSKVIGISPVKNGAICASAGNRRRWQNYHHILDPKTLSSVENVKAVWVTAESAMIADGLSTALFFVTPEKLSKHYRFAYCMIYANNRIQYSSNFPVELFTKG